MKAWPFGAICSLITAMALPSRDKTFAFADCRDVLDKLKREVGRYKAAYEAGDLESMKDVAFNISITGWQLCEWVFADMTAAQQSDLKITTKREMQDRASRECPAIRMFYQTATASKHWVVSRYPDPEVAVVVTANAISLADEPRSAPSRDPVKLLPTQTNWCIFFFDGQQKYDAEFVFDLALEWWSQFIHGNNIAG